MEKTWKLQKHPAFGLSIFCLKDWNGFWDTCAAKFTEVTNRCILCKIGVSRTCSCQNANLSNGTVIEHQQMTFFLKDKITPVNTRMQIEKRPRVKENVIHQSRLPSSIALWSEVSMGTLTSLFPGTPISSKLKCTVCSDTFL